MESLNNILKKSLNKEFLSAIISNPREKGGIVKIKIRPVEHKRQYFVPVRRTPEQPGISPQSE